LARDKQVTPIALSLSPIKPCLPAQKRHRAPPCF
jgi:hypothetical protein